MRVALCTTCKARTQHLSQTLPRNMRDNASYQDTKFVVLDYGDRDGLAQYMRDNHRADMESGKLAYYQFPLPEGFHVGHAKNMAHRLGLLEGGDILVNIDADNYTHEEFASYIADEFARASGHPVFLKAVMVKGEMPRGINGRIAVSRNTFLKSGGYCETFDRWSPDDKDFDLRLRRMGYEARFIDPKFLDAIRHNDRMRFRFERHLSSAPPEEAQLETIHSSGKTVSNFGQIGMGVVFKNFNPEPIKLPPLPTRIFGIGMHKTGTVSLHHAFKILGFHSGHWEDAHWARRIHEEMTLNGKSPTVEGHYALSDNPIPLLYKELDRAYPGSKFILTTRSESSWLESVRRHWDPNYNRFRLAWDSDPFTHRVHKLLYGQKGFDENVMLARYRRHNREVQDYFRERPQDLLIMNLSENPSWGPLCEFLGCKVPSAPYPASNETRTKN